MKILFLDESGDHDLRIIDPQYPLFVLGGVIVEQAYAEGQMTEEVQDFKHRLFGREDLILHTADITRNRNGFEQLKETSFRQHFYEELNKLMKKLEYKVVACVIRKDVPLSRYGIAAIDPYLFSLDVLVERFCMEVGNVIEGGMILAEKRGITLDHEIELAWLNLKIQGTRYIQASKVESRIAALNLRHKSENLAGLQLADLVVTPIGRYVLGKKIKEDYEIIRSKFRTSREGEIDGHGLVILPK